jgi:hypothetical protein
MSTVAIATTIPVTHAAKQKNSRRSPRSIGISRLPYTSPVLGYLDPPSFSLRSIPDSGTITNYFMPASRTRLPGHILCGDHWSP